jgi:hypothetical protein
MVRLCLKLVFYLFTLSVVSSARDKKTQQELSPGLKNIGCAKKKQQEIPVSHSWSISQEPSGSGHDKKKTRDKPLPVDLTRG